MADVLKSRRQLLKWSVGAGQLALLERLGLLSLGRAHAQTVDAPTRLVTLYVPGGWRPHYLFWPGTDAEVAQAVPAPQSYSGEPVFFRASDLVDLAPGDGRYPALRTWRSWDAANPALRDATHSPMMYGFTHFKLYEQLSVLHGIDQGTNDHQSGFIASMCGVAGADYRAPAIQSVVANHFYARFRDSRPLPCVIVADQRGTPVGIGLPSHAAPVRVPSIDALKPALSAKPADNPWWTGLDARTARPEVGFGGAPTGSQLASTALEDFTLRQVRKYRGRSTARVDKYLEGIHGSLTSVSRVLAADVVSVLETTKGVEALTASKPSYLSSYGLGPFGYTFGLANFHQTALEAPLEMTLRLLKSGLTSAVHCSLAPDFDTHNGIGNEHSCAHGRALADCLARFIGELKASPLPGSPGKTLLDDTLVLIQSEFGRSWYSPGYSPDDHHPYTSVIYAGGGVAANHMVGSYTPRGLGLNVSLVEENGQPNMRVPRAADAVTTALRIMGLGFDQFFIPGGYAEVTGIRRT